MDRNVFLINPPTDDTPSEYFLILYSKGWSGGRPTVIAVDELRYVTEGLGRYEGWRAGRLVVAFPNDNDYRLLHRDLVSVVTAVEAATRQKAEDEELTKVLGPEKPEEHPGFNAAAYR